MYLGATLFFGAAVLETLLEELIFGWLGYSEVPRAVDRASMLAFGFVCGAFGNRWYLAHVHRIIEETRALALPEDEHLRALCRLSPNVQTRPVKNV